MATEYTWVIAALDCYPEHDGHADVVVTAHWRLNGTDGEHTAGVYGTQGFTLDEEVPFTPFENLTKDQVVGWVKDALGEETVAAHEENIAKQIADQANPPVVNPPLPWAE